MMIKATLRYYSSLFIRYYPIVFILFFVFCFSNIYGQEWEFVTQSEQIKVFKRQIAPTNYSEIKVEAILPCGIEELLQVHLDIRAMKEWSTIPIKIIPIKTYGDSTQIYFQESIVAWPLTNREVVIKKTYKATHNGVLIAIENINGYELTQPDNIKIKEVVGSWKLTPINEKSTHIIYVMYVNPGGDIPAWILETNSAELPINMIKSIVAQAKKEKYQTKKKFSFYK